MERLYIVCYDIRSNRRWRKVFKCLHGYGEWLQLSIFQCRLCKIRRIELEAELYQLTKHDEDHVLIMDMGPADKVIPKIDSIGQAYEPINRQETIV